MSEINIATLLDKYRHIIPTEVVIREAVTTALHKTGITLPVEDISYSNGTVHINAHPLVKSKIMRQQAAIKNEIESKLSHRIHGIQ
jgi:hypothetical protein